MSQDNFLKRIDSNFTLNTSCFLSDIGIFATFSRDDPMETLERFMVQSITHCKDLPTLRTTSQHEFIAIKLMDTHRSGSKPIILILDRIASVVRAPPSYFTSHSDSGAILDTIVKYLKEKATGSRSNDSSESLPLHPLATEPTALYPYLDLIEDPELPTESTEGYPNPSPLNLSLRDAVSLSVVGALSASVRSSTTTYHAEDSFRGGTHVDVYAPGLRNVRQIECSKFSLFDLAVLADTVHNYDPLYSILKSQCYWYARIICDIVEDQSICSSSNGDPSSGNVGDPTMHGEEGVCIPLNSYLPDLAGRWIGGILVNKVEEAVLSLIISKFKQNRQTKMEEVCLTFILKCAC